ncbi:glutathione S-transferase family protein [Pseudaestuariivita atlantica]|uniref:Glutathione S-transferase n=1 Tax=Pseudaestuariivita atlantica TaxID=1317121 RepID=A0A0L1JLB0_9RHOB|nr:glutathione S-transferase family protein [Pseudaestuariivita atlantica]KNG92539.1 hypothetical protein ATO11_16030 [Pseudaestuariivita atlantica]
MLTVYGRRSSSNVQLVMWAIGEMGLAHERLEYGHGYAPLDTPDFLAMNPNGGIPVLRDGDLTLFEAGAIFRYLCARYGDDTLWPADPARRAPLDVWAEWGKLTFAPTLGRIFAYEVRTRPEDQDPAELAGASRAVARLARILDARLGQGPWLAGEAFTFADMGVGHVLYRYHIFDWERPDLPNLSAYYDRLQTRAAFRDHAMVPVDELRGSYWMPRP